MTTTAKQTVPGRPSTIIGNKIIVRHGDVVDVYNADYYRIADEPVSRVESEVRHT